MKKTMISVKNLAYSYTKEPVLTDVNFELKEKESMAIYGSNGSGKSTLLRLILGELKAKENSVYICNEDVTNKKDWSNVGYVPQSTISKNIAFPVTCEEILASSQYRQMGLIKMAGKNHFKKANEVLEHFNLSAYAKIPFKELSGGLQQRVMIARAMVEKPELLILDEPTAGVDEKSNRDFLTILNELKIVDGLAYIIVTHERKLVEDIVELDQAFELKNGRLKHV
ncbi:MAG: ATP-binding cassette domain-containing protein [Christensenellaceae bacterium]|nr:ATP-binding cassette domain-containing protein [Christensenellaceae bacterium]